MAAWKITTIEPPISGAKYIGVVECPANFKPRNTSNMKGVLRSGTNNVCDLYYQAGTRGPEVDLWELCFTFTGNAPRTVTINAFISATNIPTHDIPVILDGAGGGPGATVAVPRVGAKYIGSVKVKTRKRLTAADLKKLVTGLIGRKKAAAAGSRKAVKKAAKTGGAKARPARKTAKKK
ncbi:MAG: hypothetical protein KIT10_06040 [Flavobacteriales bacterium]|nr:hypothetical protein [Flavobacteriales bacterium]